MVELAYSLSGIDGAPVVVLSHSLGADRRMWQPQREIFERHFRVLSVDTRGHGASPAPQGPYRIDELGGDFLALLDRLGLTRVSWCGLSLGGMIGMWLAGHSPERIDRLALCCTGPHLPPASDWRQRAATVRTHHSTAPLVETVLARWFSPDFHRAHPGRVAEFRDVFTATDPEGYAGCCEAIAAMDQRDDLHRITADTLVLAGTDDPATPPDVGSALAAAIGRSRFITVPGRHLATAESASATSAALLAHLIAK